MNAKPSRELGNILRQVPSSTVINDTRPVLERSEQAVPTALPVITTGSTGGGEGRLQDKVPGPASTDTEVPLQVTVPRRVRKDLLVMAADQDCSVRALILRAVRSLGVEVAEDELRDKRRKS